MGADGAAVAAAAIGAVNSVVDERPIEGLDDLLGAAEVGEIAPAFAGQQGVHGMVEIVAPLRVESVTSRLRRIEQAHVVQIALGNDVHAAAEPPGLFVGRLLDLPQDVPRAAVIDRVDRVESAGRRRGSRGSSTAHCRGRRPAPRHSRGRRN